MTSLRETFTAKMTSGNNEFKQSDKFDELVTKVAALIEEKCDEEESELFIADMLIFKATGY